MTLTIVQTFLIGLAASIIVAGLKLLAAKKGIIITRDIATIIVGVVAAVLAVIWLIPTWGPITDFSVFVAKISEQSAQILGFGTLIYNVILERVLNLMNLTVRAMLPVGTLPQNIPKSKNGA